MADLSSRLPENVDGDFFVDDTCIDCETCMVVAPEFFDESARNLSFVHAQPKDAAGIRRAMMALIACPTASIGTVSRRTSREAAHAFPDPIAPDVFYCGYASEDSFGASSYLIVRPDGNVLVDSPRAAAPLLAGIEKLGGARWLFLTHRDDVADHEKLRARFGCERVMMRADARGMTIETALEGNEPVELAPDLTIIPVPGHTRGSAALLFRNEVLFTGDHLWGNGNGTLGASKRVSWHSWPEQLKSLEKLLDVPFKTVLPGHGRRLFADNNGAMNDALKKLLARLT